jgi:glycosyltransferase 2 family protein
MNMKRLLSITFTFLCLAVAFHFLDLDQLNVAIQKVNPWMLSLAILASFIHFLIFGVRWQQIVHEVTLSVPFWQHVTDYLYGVFVETFTPANVGGDVYRSVVLRKYRVFISKIIMLLIRDHFLGFFAHLLLFFLLLVCVIFFYPEQLVASWNLFLIVAVVTFVAVVLMLMIPFTLDLAKRWQWIHKIDMLAKVFTHLRNAVRFQSIWEFMRLIGVTSLGLCFWILTVYIVALDLGTELSLVTIGMISIMVEIVRMVPLTVQGIGLREGIFAQVFVLLDLSPEHGFILGLISYIVMSISMLISGLVVLLPSFQGTHIPPRENDPVL